MSPGYLGHIMPGHDSERNYRLYGLVRFALEVAAIAVAGLWVLPSIGLEAHPWIIFALVVGWAIYTALSTGAVAGVINKKAVVGPESFVGAIGKAITPLCPEGYVRLGTELWKARSTTGTIEPGSEVEVVEVHRLTLTVRLACLEDERKHPG